MTTRTFHSVTTLLERLILDDGDAILGGTMISNLHRFVPQTAAGISSGDQIGQPHSISNCCPASSPTYAKTDAK